jgi:hypothetical protein
VIALLWLWMWFQQTVPVLDMGSSPAVWTTGCNQQWGVLGADGLCHATIQVKEHDFKNLTCSSPIAAKGSNVRTMTCTYIPKP